MLNLTHIDLPTRLAPVLPRWMAELVAALLVLAVTGLIRLALDALAPGVAPFVLLFPAALLATLVGGWRAGLAVVAVSEFCAWYFIIPPRGLTFKGEAQPANLLAILIAAALVVALVEAYRASMQREAAERGAQIAERDLMLRELEHRMKNNFQTVASLIQMQLRRASDESARAALSQALNRVISISEAHRNLYAIDEGPSAVDMSRYLPELCANLGEALFLGELVRLECRVAPGALERDRAVAIGLIVNELVTNAAKHAFEDGGPGEITVDFGPLPSGYRLVVADDGKGLPADFATRRQGLGRGLVEAFTRQAGGALTVGEGPGARFEVHLTA